MPGSGEANRSLYFKGLQSDLKNNQNLIGPSALQIGLQIANFLRNEKLKKI